MAEAAGNLTEFNLISVEEGVKNGQLKVCTSHILIKKNRNVSIVWSVFEDIHRVADNALLAKFVWCPRCKKPLDYDSAKGTNKLHNHLKKCADVTDNNNGRY